MPLNSLEEKIVAGIIGGMTVAVVLGIWRAVTGWLWKVDATTLGTLASLLANGEYLFGSGRGYSEKDFGRWQVESQNLLKAVEEVIAKGISKKEAERFMTAPRVNTDVRY
jgi:Crp-like helix-turn-helix domain